MNSFRKKIKLWLFNHAPVWGGRIHYFGACVYAPRGNYVIDLLLRSWDGVYEREIFQRIIHAVRPSSCFFDVGANIGLMSLPVLHEYPDVRVVSFEPSPSSTPFLAKTIAGSPYRDRWQLVAKAVADQPGTADFCASNSGMGAFDGLRDTGRSEMERVKRSQVPVEITTLDLEWEALGKPDVSAVKIDVEGAELGVLRGAEKLIEARRPNFVVEWSRRNLPAYGTDFGELFRFASRHSYLLFTGNQGIPIRSEQELRFQMWEHEEFVLTPDA